MYIIIYIYIYIKGLSSLSDDDDDDDDDPWGLKHLLVDSPEEGWYESQDPFTRSPLKITYK